MQGTTFLMKPLILLVLTGITALSCSRGQHEAGDQSEAAARAIREAQRAMALFERGRLAEAKAAFFTVRLHFTELFGPRDPATLNSRNNLASVLHAMGDYEEAEAANRAALTMCERSLGRLHPDALASRRNLAVTLLNLGKLEDALEHARRVESGRRRVFGTEHPEYEEAVLLKESIEEALERGKQDDEAPRGGPTGLGESAVGVS
jgi:tetratricopeptide (TPR) repeat protein